MTDYIVRVIETPTQVVVTQEPKGIVVTDKVIQVITMGVQGPPGPSGSSGAGFNFYSTTVDYTVNLSQYNYISVDASGDPVTITLPLSSNSNKGQAVYVAKVDNTAFAVTVQTTSTQPIDDGTSSILDAYQVQMFVSTGSGWKIS